MADNREPKTLLLELTRAEACMLQRALGSHAESDMLPQEDQPRIRWVAARLLRLTNPELGFNPIEALHEKMGQALIRDSMEEKDARRRGPYARRTPK